MIPTGVCVPVRLKRARSVISTALRPLSVLPLNCVAELIKGLELVEGKAPQRAAQDTVELVALKDETGSMLGIRAAVSVLNKMDVSSAWRVPRVPYEFFKPSSLTDRSEARRAAVLWLDLTPGPLSEGLSAPLAVTALSRGDHETR